MNGVRFSATLQATTVTHKTATMYQVTPTLAHSLSESQCSCTRAWKYGKRSMAQNMWLI